MAENITIFYKKPKIPKEILPFSDGSNKIIPYQKNTIYLDQKGNTWISTLNENVVYTLEDFLYETRSKKQLSLTKILDYWD